MALTPIHAHQRRLYFKQAGDGTFRADPANAYDFYLDALNTEQLRTARRIMLDTQQATGREFPVTEVPTEYELPSQPVSAWLDHHLLAFLLGYGLGTDTVDVAGTNRTHAFNLIDKNSFPPTFPVEDHLEGEASDATIDFEHLGCWTDSWTLEWGTEDFVTATWNIAGSGDTGVVGTQIESADTQMGVNGYFTANKTRVWYKAADSEHNSSWSGTHTPQAASGVFTNDDNFTGATATNLSELCTSFRLNFSNNPVRARSGGTSSGSGIYGAQPKIGRREVSLEIEGFQQGTDAETKVLLTSTRANNYEASIGIEFVSDVAIGSSFYSGFIVLPLVGLRAIPDSGGAMDDLRTKSWVYYAKEAIDSSHNPIYGFVENGTTTAYGLAPV
jgi:hypothetical protein